MIRRPLLSSNVVIRLTSAAPTQWTNGARRKDSRVLALGCVTAALLATGTGCAKKPAAEPTPLAPPSPVAAATPVAPPPAQPVAASPAPSGDAQAIGEYLVFVGQTETERQALVRDMLAFVEQQQKKIAQSMAGQSSTTPDPQAALQESTAQIAQMSQRAGQLRDAFRQKIAPTACNGLATAYGGALDALSGAVQSSSSTQDPSTAQLAQASQELERLRKDTPGLPPAALSFTIATQ